MNVKKFHPNNYCNKVQYMGKTFMKMYLDFLGSAS